ncbi:hypothetical protein ACMFMG_007672 [Clarireedia jacksonii]
MAPRIDDVADEEPPSINPYEVLGLEKTASEDEIKRAYRKAALRHHPDKAAEHLKEESHTKFQEVAFAYAVLSDPARRKRYDRTGSTSESIGADGFSWSDFYSEQFRDIVTTDSIEQFAKSYKGSEEEKDDLLSAYEKFKGKWNKMYEVVMLSDPVDDEERFRKIIEEAIEKGEVKEYEIFRNESKAAKAKRMKKARAEEGEAAELAKKLGASKMLAGAKEDKSSAKKRKAEGHMNDLAAIIQSRQASRMGSMIAHMESKYGAVDGKDLDLDEPSEEAFQRTRKKMTKGKAMDDTEEEEEEEPKPKRKSRAKSNKKQVEESDDEVVDLEKDSDMDKDHDDDEEGEDEYEEEAPPKKHKKSAPAKKSKKAAGTATRKSKRTKAA